MRFSTDPLPHSPRPLSPHQPGYPATASAIPAVMGPLLAVVFTDGDSHHPLDRGGTMPEYRPLNMCPSAKGSHLGNTGPFWQIRIPLGKLGSPWRFCGSPLMRLRVPPAAITGPIRRTVRMGIYAEGAIESEPPPPRPPAGSPLPP